ncbi:hypothetical protein KIN20_005689 [Parelaphostrongylus tenuis]|uniref:L-Fucosyltransferase n=1 Tax=Parelaphostrongylus tenuis TaxID=148309 RepID=A0AAD5MT47_PARTN|nr:hypothetical protein KIN20_005689 [Parelaphostrongylus tenuis]
MASCRHFIIGVIAIQCLGMVLYEILFVTNNKQEKRKYVGFHLNYGGLGNQLFHLITGYGIARTLTRIHYLPCEKPRSYVLKQLQKIEEAFPLLRNTYVLSPNGTKESITPFAGSCCAYDNPRRLLSESAEHLLLNFIYGQNPRYFDEYLPEIRNLLRFSDKVRREGRYIMDTLQIHDARMLCIHIRMTDFVWLNVSTNANDTVSAANAIAKQQGISRFMIFGDDQNFIHRLAKTIVKDGNWKTDAVVASNFNEVTDLYLASQVCQSFLITAATSTFGWWLAFFIKDQNAVFYMQDNRRHADKVPSKELFLTSWRQYSR